MYIWDRYDIIAGELNQETTGASQWLSADGGTSGSVYSGYDASSSGGYPRYRITNNNSTPSCIEIRNSKAYYKTSPSKSRQMASGSYGYQSYGAWLIFSSRTSITSWRIANYNTTGSANLVIRSIPENDDTVSNGGIQVVHISIEGIKSSELGSLNDDYSYRVRLTSYGISGESQGSYIDYVTSTSSSTYPSNGVSGNYWYERR